MARLKVKTWISSEFGSLGSLVAAVMTVESLVTKPEVAVSSVFHE